MNEENIKAATTLIQLTCVPDEATRLSIEQAAVKKSDSLILYKWESRTTYPVTSEENFTLFITLIRNPEKTLESDLQKPITDIEVSDFFRQYNLGYKTNPSPIIKLLQKPSAKSIRDIKEHAELRRGNFIATVYSEGDTDFLRLERNIVFLLGKERTKPISELDIFKTCLYYDLIYEGNVDLIKPDTVTMLGQKYYIVNNKQQAMWALSQDRGELNSTDFENMTFPCVIKYDPELIDYIYNAYFVISIDEFNDLMKAAREETMLFLNTLDRLMQATSSIQQLNNGNEKAN